MSEMTKSKLQNYIFVYKKSHVHLHYAFNICAKFQNECLKTQRGVEKLHNLAIIY